MRLLLLSTLIMLLVAAAPHASRGAALATAAPDSTAIDNTVEAGEADAEEPRRKLVKWNEYDGPISTLRFGFGFLVDVVGYSQDDGSKAQLPTFDNPDAGLRDFRVLLKGKFKTTRPFSWTLGYMYDGADEEWHFRQTGIIVGVPELKGNFFVGRTKEGYSMIKVMVGYHGWTNERSPANDAFVPILADGIKYMGYYERPRVYLSLGAYKNGSWENPKFATADEQVVARLGWLPRLEEDGQELLYVGAMTRAFTPDNGSIQPRARGGSYLGPYFVDAGRFDSDHGRTDGVEAFYRKGPWLFGTEYHWQNLTPTGEGDVLFHGGNAVVTWNITGETRPYNVRGAYFQAVSPKQTVFEGGPGAWEAVLDVSYVDLDSGRFHGGKYWRLTPMVNWHMSDNVRLEFTYGYGELDRFGLTGATQFFQGRVQFTL
ncbi:MAG TPA: porin [Candidatus Krumholzibacteria bacterium]|nr:porin [Candidatus Krumholzibacteria bacterium]